MRWRRAWQNADSWAQVEKLRRLADPRFNAPEPERATATRMANAMEARLKEKGVPKPPPEPERRRGPTPDWWEDFLRNAEEARRRHAHEQEERRARDEARKRAEEEARQAEARRRADEEARWRAWAEAEHARAAKAERDRRTREEKSRAYTSYAERQEQRTKERYRKGTTAHPDQAGRHVWSGSKPVFTFSKKASVWYAKLQHQNVYIEASAGKGVQCKPQGVVLSDPHHYEAYRVRLLFKPTFESTSPPQTYLFVPASVVNDVWNNPGKATSILSAWYRQRARTNSVWTMATSRLSTAWIDPMGKLYDLTEGVEATDLPMATNKPKQPITNHLAFAYAFATSPEGLVDRGWVRISSPYAIDLPRRGRLNESQLWTLVDFEIDVFREVGEEKPIHVYQQGVGNSKLSLEEFVDTFGTSAQQERYFEMKMGAETRRRRFASANRKQTGRNPKKGDLYDPRDEQIRAQRQGIYEAQVRKALGLKYDAPFRDSKGRRIDVGYEGKMPFGMGTSVPTRYGRLLPGSQEPTPKAYRESASRYEDVDHLIRNRQDYEETLGMQRKSGFYRVTPEPTHSGIRYFIWPLPPGRRLPLGFSSASKAQAKAESLNASADPRRTGDWWKPPGKTYTASELSDWLPPASAFGAKVKVATADRKAKKVTDSKPKTRKSAKKAGSTVKPTRKSPSVKKVQVDGRDAWQIVGTKRYFFSREKAERMAS